MGSATVSVAVEDAGRFTRPTARDDVEILLAVRLRHRAAGGAKAASGGELSRVMLAIEVATGHRGHLGADLRLRRGGRRGRRPGRARRRRPAGGRWPGTPRWSSSPTSRRSPRTPTGTWSSSESDDGHVTAQRGARGRRASERVRELARMLGGSEHRRRARSTPRDLMARARGLAPTWHDGGRCPSAFPPAAAAAPDPGSERSRRASTARTKDLTKRLRPGDIAVIDHLDLDRVSAEALVACRPAAVVNAARRSPGATRTSARRSSSRPASR